MPNIKPASDLRNYTKVTEAATKLIAELEKGRISGKKEGWYALDEVRTEFGIGNA